jgi:3-isopropylmalate/(R)-2-methylmalate dehydratase small subunit
MEPFKLLRAVAAPFPGINVDTDQILPARFLSKPRAGGFGQYLFHDLRFDEAGKETMGSGLNQLAFKTAKILVGEQNFGCGSSRENAVWAIHDYGFRAVIAPSFGDIFYNNSLKNGLLPVVVSADAVRIMIQSLQAQPGQMITVDLENQTVTDTVGKAHGFDIDPFSKHCLLKGIDELDYTLSQMDKITAFEQRHFTEEGWPHSGQT